MSAPYTLLLLGDSASAPTGGFFPTYVEALLAGWGGARPLEVVNLSAVGMTSADALALWREWCFTKPVPDALLIYLGHCDACAFGYRKPRRPKWAGAGWSRWRDRLYKRFTPSSQRVPRYQFTPQTDLFPLRECVSQADFVANIGDLVESGLKAGARVVLVNPTSKTDYPPCNNTGNFIFYKIFGLLDAHPYRVEDAEDEDAPDLLPLRAALNYHGRGELGQAELLYQALQAKLKAELSYAEVAEEVGAICTNNLADLAFQRGDFAEALALLEACPRGEGVLTPILDFNRAQALRRLGRDAEAQAALARAKAEDMGTYRIKEGYREALRTVAQEIYSPAFHYLDLAPLVGDADFVDYCHPTPQAHARIGAALADLLRPHAGSGTGGGVERYQPANPDFFIVPEHDFFGHFDLSVTPDPAFSEAVKAAARRWTYAEVLERLKHPRLGAQDRALFTLLAHPIAGEAAFIHASPPDGSFDQGRVGEFYALRHFIGLYEAPPSAWGGYPRLAAFWPQAGRFERWLKAAPTPPVCLERGALARLFAAGSAEVWWSRLVLAWADFLAGEPSAPRRVRSISYWFFRESLLFGSASHASAWYERLALWRVVDGLGFMASFAPPDPLLTALAESIEAFLALYERLIAPYAARPYDLPAATLADFADEVRAIATQTKNFSKENRFDRAS